VNCVALHKVIKRLEGRLKQKKDQKNLGEAPNKSEGTTDDDRGRANEKEMKEGLRK